MTIPTPSARSRRVAWTVVAVLFATASLNYADRTALSAVFPLLQKDLGMSDLELAGIGSLFLWSYALASPVSGWLADRKSRRAIIVTSLSLWSVITIWTGMVHSTTELLLTRILLGLAESAYIPAAVGLIADHHRTETRATALGIHFTGLNFGLIAGGALAGHFGEAYGWRFSLLVLGTSGLLLAAVAYFFLKDRPATPAGTTAVVPRLKPQIARLATSPAYLLVVAQAMLISIGVWMFFNWMPLYYAENFGLSLAAAGFSGTAALQISASIGALSGGYLSDSFARKGLERRPLMMCISYLGAAPFLLVFAGDFSIVVVTVAIVLFSFGRALAASNESAILCDVLAAHDRSTAQALMNSMNCLAGGMGVFFAGYMRSEWGLSGAFASVTLIVLATATISFVAYRVQRRQGRVLADT